MRFLPVVMAAAAALTIAAPAAAKELQKAELCGPAGCIAVTDRDELRHVPLEGVTEATQPPLQAFHMLRLTIDTGGGQTDVSTMYYADRAGMIAFRGERATFVWWQLSGAEATFMKQLARNVKAFPAPKLTATIVGGRPVSADPASYLTLFQQTGRRLDAQTIPHDWVRIDFASTTPSPWTDAPFELMYSPSTNAIERGIDQIVLPGDIAADIEAARPLAPDSGTRWLPWLVLGGLVATLLLLAGLGALLRQRLGAAPTPEPAG